MSSDPKKWQKPGFFSHQRLGSLGLKKEYLPESFSHQLFLKHEVFDASRNSFALYRDEFVKLKAYVREKHQGQRLDDLNRQEFLTALNEAKLKLIIYYNEDNLSPFELAIDSLRHAAPWQNNGGQQALADDHQNCLIFSQGKMFMHPKLRSEPEGRASHLDAGLTGLVGVSHTSFTLGRRASFVGSVVEDHQGWVIENTTGHYATRATQLRHFLNELVERGVDLSGMRVKCWVPRTPSNSGDAEANYHILIEDALSFLTRVNENVQRIESLHL